MLSWPDQELPHSVAFVSDLHLFSSRCNAEAHWDAMIKAASASRMVVFGGDLFDFRWSQVGCELRTADAAVRWLEKFIDQAAGPRDYLYLFGNHDGDSALREALGEFAQQCEAFTIAGDLLRVDDTVFLHGDAVEANGDLARFEAYRSRWSGKARAGPAQSRAYDAAISLGAHRVAAALAHRRRRTCQRLLHYLSHHDCGPEEGIRRVVFGHTHRYLPGHWYAGVKFYNPGATIRGVPFQPVLLHLEHPG
jgi:UDP-2,3-diacylglucosamine hydrolase